MQALPHVYDVMGVAFRPDGRWRATAGEDAKVKLWRLSDPGRAPAAR